MEKEYTFLDQRVNYDPETDTTELEIDDFRGVPTAKWTLSGNVPADVITDIRLDEDGENYLAYQIAEDIEWEGQKKTLGEDWMGTAWNMVKDAPDEAQKTLSGLVSALNVPQTMKAMADVGAVALDSMLQSSMGIDVDTDHSALGSAIWNEVSKKYIEPKTGKFSVDRFRYALENNFADVLADVSTITGLGSGSTLQLSKMSGLNRMQELSRRGLSLADKIDPLGAMVGGGSYLSKKLPDGARFIDKKMKGLNISERKLPKAMAKSVDMAREALYRRGAQISSADAKMFRDRQPSVDAEGNPIEPMEIENYIINHPQIGHGSLFNQKMKARELSLASKKLVDDFTKSYKGTFGGYTDSTPSRETLGLPSTGRGTIVDIETGSPTKRGEKRRTVVDRRKQDVTSSPDLSGLGMRSDKKITESGSLEEITSYIPLADDKRFKRIETSANKLNRTYNDRISMVTDLALERLMSSVGNKTPKGQGRLAKYKDWQRKTKNGELELYDMLEIRRDVDEFLHPYGTKDNKGNLSERTSSQQEAHDIREELNDSIELAGEEAGFDFKQANRETQNLWSAYKALEDSQFKTKRGRSFDHASKILTIGLLSGSAGADMSTGNLFFSPAALAVLATMKISESPFVTSYIAKRLEGLGQKGLEDLGQAIDRFDLGKKGAQIKADQMRWGNYVDNIILEAKDILDNGGVIPKNMMKASRAGLGALKRTPMSFKSLPVNLQNEIHAALESGRQAMRDKKEMARLEDNIFNLTPED